MEPRSRNGSTEETSALDKLAEKAEEKVPATCIVTDSVMVRVKIPVGSDREEACRKAKNAIELVLPGSEVSTSFEYSKDTTWEGTGKRSSIFYKFFPRMMKSTTVKEGPDDYILNIVYDDAMEFYARLKIDFSHPELIRLSVDAGDYPEFLMQEGSGQREPPLLPRVIVSASCRNPFIDRTVVPDGEYMVKDVEVSSCRRVGKKDLHFGHATVVSRLLSFFNDPDFEYIDSISCGRILSSVLGAMPFPAEKK
jgi:hypothetical protein